jgi:hypothetical protein
MWPAAWTTVEIERMNKKAVRKSLGGRGKGIVEEWRIELDVDIEVEQGSLLLLIKGNEEDERF